MKKFKTVLLGLALAAMATTQAWGGLSYYNLGYTWGEQYTPVGWTNQGFYEISARANGMQNAAELAGILNVLEEIQTSGTNLGFSSLLQQIYVHDDMLAWSNATALVNASETWRAHRMGECVGTFTYFGVPGFIARRLAIPLYYFADIMDDVDMWYKTWHFEGTNVVVGPNLTPGYYLRGVGFIGGREPAWEHVLNEQTLEINFNFYPDWLLPTDPWPNPLREIDGGDYLDDGAHPDNSITVMNNLELADVGAGGLDCRFATNFTPRTVVVMFKSDGDSQFKPGGFVDFTTTDINAGYCTTLVDVPAGTNRTSIIVDDIGPLHAASGSYTITIPAGKSFLIGKVLDSYAGVGDEFGYANGVSAVGDQITMYDSGGGANTVTITNHSGGVLKFGDGKVYTWPTLTSLLYKNNHTNAIKLTMTGAKFGGCSLTNALFSTNVTSGWAPLCWPFPETKTFGSMNFPVTPGGMSVSKWDVANGHWDTYTYDSDEGWDVNPSNVSFVPGEGFLVYLTSATNWVMNLPEVVSTNQLKSIEITIPSGYSLPDLGITVTCENGLTHTIPTVAAGMKFHVCGGDTVAFEYSDEVTEGMYMCQMKSTDCFGHKSTPAVVEAGPDGYTHTIYLTTQGYSSSAPAAGSDYTVDEVARGN